MVLKNENRKRIVIVNPKLEDEPKLLFRARIPGYGGMPARGSLKTLRMYGCIPPLAVRDAARVQKHPELLGSGLGILSSQGCPSTEDEAVQQIVYKPCRTPTFCRCINIPRSI